MTRHVHLPIPEELRGAIAAAGERTLEHELSREVPEAEIRALAAAGIGRLRLPEEHGGFGHTWREQTEVLFELATQDSNIPQTLRGHIAIEEEALWRGAKSDVSRAWLARLAAGDLVGDAWTEPGKGGYDGFQTRLVETPDGPRVTGEKAYTTGSLVADWLDVTARDEGGRELGLIVCRDQPGVSVRDDWPGFGQKTTASGGASLENAIVDAYEVRLLDDRYPYQAAVFQQVLLIVLAGIVAAAARQAGEELRNRKRAYTHGNTARAGDDPQLLQAIGEVDATAALARAQVLETATALDEAFATRGSAREEQREAAREADLATARAQVALRGPVLGAVSRLFDALGASATDEAKGLDRYWRNARTVLSHNPWVYKARIVGDWLVNGTGPVGLWGVGIPEDAKTAAQPVG